MLKKIKKMLGIVTKRDLKEEISFYKAQIYNPVEFVRVERDVREVRAHMPLEENIPVEIIETKIAQMIGQSLKNDIEYRVVDSFTSPHRLLEGRLFVAKRR